jgi:crotonobetainyl-CoA:carnitine CoA-transferase CaiB-like acyl-CoA transferase
MARERSGAGQRVETSLLQATVSFTSENAARYFATGRVPDRAARTRQAQVYAFVAGDGLPFVVHLSSPQKFWDGLLRSIAREDLGADPRFRTRPERQRHHDELRALLQDVFRAEPRATWLARLEQNDVPCAPLNRLDEVFADPQVQELGMRVTAHHPRYGSIDLVAPGVSLQGTPLTLRLPPPALGEHNDEVLGPLGLPPH